MGIQDLTAVIKDNASTTISTHGFSQFKDCYIAIDTSIWANVHYRPILSNYIKDDPDSPELFSVNKDGLRKAWISRMLEIGLTFLKHSITPIFVLDGASLPLKASEKEKRAKTNARTKELYEQYKQEYLDTKGAFERTDKYDKFRSAFINQIPFDHTYIKSFQEILVKLNIPVIKCKEESDILIAALWKEKYINAVYTKDTDLVIYGLPLLLTGISGNSFTSIDCNEFMEICELSRDQLIDLAILLGTDYNDRVYGVGPKKAFDFIKTYGKLELLPSKIYKPASNRSLIRNRFKNIPSLESLTLESNEIKKVTLGEILNNEDVFDNYNIGYLISKYSPGD